MNTTTTETRKNFETVKRNFETAFSSGRDYSAELLDLSTAVAYSVLNKCLDPQRKTAVDREQVSDNGQNPALLAVKRGIAADRRTLDSTKTLADRSTRITFNTDGDAVTVTADKEADKALGVVLRERLTDGIDLVQEAAAAILEQAAEHADPAAPWLDASTQCAACRAVCTFKQRTAPHMRTQKQHPFKRFTAQLEKPCRTAAQHRQTPATATLI